jgi:hypothetical protein
MLSRLLLWLMSSHTRIPIEVEHSLSLIDEVSHPLFFRAIGIAVGLVIVERDTGSAVDGELDEPELTDGL